MAAVFYSVQTVLPQMESVIFQASAGYARHVPLRLVPRILAAGAAHAALWVPLAVLVLGRWRVAASTKEAPRPSPSFGEWIGKALPAAFVYVAFYFMFGYYVAWRDPVITAYYQGHDPGTFWLQIRNVLRDTPWLPPLQAVRGLLWCVLAVVVLRTIKGSLAEKALAVGALFAVMSSGLLLPNAFMPHEVRMVHLVETASSNFLFGVLVGWWFGRGRAAPRPPQRGLGEGEGEATAGHGGQPLSRTMRHRPSCSRRHTELNVPMRVPSVSNTGPELRASVPESTTSTFSGAQAKGACFPS